MDSDQPVFLDGDGDIIAQVLNYLQHGSITLPLTVSNGMLLRNIECYGIKFVVEDGDTCEDSDKMFDNFHEHI